MNTMVYFVRHAESPYIEGAERARGLSEKGEADAIKVQAQLKREGIQVYVSSPYQRAIQTIIQAGHHHQVVIVEDLKEREIGLLPSDISFKEAKRKVYQNFDFSFENGESSKQAQQRAVTSLLQLLQTFNGKRVAVGTHGDIMTLMLNYFDKSYHYAFWETTTMPDIYKLEFRGTHLNGVTRLYIS